MEIILKNKYTEEFNMKIVRAAIEKIKIDIDTVKKIYITNKVINFVIKKSPILNN